MLIETIQKNSDKHSTYKIILANEYSFNISEEDFLILGLYEKQEISEDELEKIKFQIIKRDAKESALGFVTYKLRSESELRNKLTSDGVPIECADEVVGELKSLGYVNDLLYAQKYIFDRSKLNPKSNKLLKHELIQKGIKIEIIDNAIEEYSENEETIAFRLLKKKFGKYELDDDKIVKRCYSYLVHRGFDYDLIKQTIEKLRIMRD